MNRAVLGDGRWFDKEKAKGYEDDTRWNGHNHISVATGDQWVRSKLWHTASGMWILETSGPFSMSYDYPVQYADAMRWLIDNGHFSHVPEEFLSSTEV